MAPSAAMRAALALLYFIFISVMFFLPGSVLPHETWLSKIYFDKWVHIGFFALLLLLWLWVLQPAAQGTFVLLLLAATYGMLVEVIQDRFVQNRSMDLGDWIADMTGSALGVWLWHRYIKK